MNLLKLTGQEEIWYYMILLSIVLFTILVIASVVTSVVTNVNGSVLKEKIVLKFSWVGRYEALLFIWLLYFVQKAVKLRFATMKDSYGVVSMYVMMLMLMIVSIWIYFKVIEPLVNWMSYKIEVEGLKKLFAVWTYSYMFTKVDGIPVVEFIQSCLSIMLGVLIMEVVMSTFIIVILKDLIKYKWVKKICENLDSKYFRYQYYACLQSRYRYGVQCIVLLVSTGMVVLFEKMNGLIGTLLSVLVILGYMIGVGGAMLVRECIKLRAVNDLEIQHINLTSDYINQGAYTFSIRGESEREGAYSVFNLGIKNNQKKIENICLENLTLYKTKDVEYSTDYVKLLVLKDDVQKKSYQDIIISYQEGENRYVHMVIQLEFQLYGELIFIKRKRIKKIYYKKKKGVKLKRYMNGVQKKRHIVNDKNTCIQIYNNAIINQLYFEVGDLPTLKAIDTLQSKFMFQDGVYGCGKTTEAIVGACKDGYKPIVISPWEENTAENFIYSLFVKVRMETNKMTSEHLARKTVLLYLFGATAIHINFRKTLSSIVILLGRISGGLMPPYLIIVIIYILGYLVVYKVCASQTLLFRNEITPYYKESLIADILEMIKIRDGKEYLHLIEDVDRLDVHEIEKLYRDLAAISKASGCSRVLGIVSGSTDNIIEKYKAKYGDELGVDKYKNLHKKIFYNIAPSLEEKVIKKVTTQHRLGVLAVQHITACMKTLRDKKYNCIDNSILFTCTRAKEKEMQYEQLNHLSKYKKEVFQSLERNNEGEKARLDLLKKRVDKLGNFRDVKKCMSKEIGTLYSEK